MKAHVDIVHPVLFTLRKSQLVIKMVMVDVDHLQ
jgi:hypothetical protein